MIKRPLCYAAVSLILGIVLAKADFVWTLLGVGGIVFFSICWMWKCKKKREKRIYLVAFIPIFTVVGVLRVIMLDKPLPAWDNEMVVITGTVYDMQKREKNTAVYVRDAGEESWSGIVYYDGEEVPAIGNTIQVRGKASAFENGTNPGQFQAQTYYRGLGIDFSMFQAEIIHNDGYEDGLRMKLYMFKQKLHETLNQLAGENAGILQAMLLGEKSQMDEEIKLLYQRSGISHILVISGLHFSMLGTLLYEMLQRISGKFWIAAGVSVILLCLYGVMTGFGVSAVRAFLMFGISMGATVSGRGYDMPSALGAAVCYILLDNPFVLFQTGFLLSVGAILGVIVLIPVMEQFFCIKRMREKWGKQEKQEKGIKYRLKSNLKKVVVCLAQGAVSGFAIQLVTLPILLSSFYELSMYSIFVNCLILPLLSIVIYSALAGLVTGLFVPVLGKIIMLPAVGVLKLYEEICSFAEKLPGAVLVTGEPEWYEILLYYFIIGSCVVVLRRLNDKDRHLKKRTKALGLAGVLLICYWLFLWREDKVSVSMLDVGQGQAIYMHCKEHNILYDGGSTDVSDVGLYRIVPFLKSQGVGKLDLVIVSHTDADHDNGILQILEEELMEIEMLMLADLHEPDESYQQLESVAAKRGVQVVKVKRGDHFQLDDVNFTILHPTRTYKTTSKNDKSIVMEMDYEDFSMLLTGDVEEAGETFMLEGSMQKESTLHEVDVLQVAHHGSDSSSSQRFLDIVSPKYALISCGKDNSYGHPSRNVLQRLDKIGCVCFVTMENGCLNIDVEE